MLRYVSASLLALGLGLSSLNLWGLLVDPDPAQWATRPNDTVLSADAALKLVSRNPRETELQYVERMTELVHDRITNPLERVIDSSKLLRVGPLDNWILWLAGMFPPLDRYETLDWNFGLRRGLGLCSQQAKVMVGLLRDAGIPSGIQALDGHVVAWVEVEQRQFVADPDYGVVLPYSMREIEAKPEIITPLYSKATQELGDPTLVDRLTQIYGPEGNARESRWFEHPTTAAHFTRERGIFAVKWIIPIVIAVIGGLGLTMGRFRKAPNPAKPDIKRSDRLSLQIGPER